MQDTNGIGTLNPFRYRGYYWDSELNLYYLNARYYDPEIGRFISQDNIAYLDPEKLNGLNLFAYCLNNPVMGTDPDGTWSWKAFGMILAAVVIVAAISVVTAGAAAAIGGSIAASTGITIATLHISGTAAGMIVAGTIGVTTFACGMTAGIGEIVNQVETKGAENINLGTIALSTTGGALDGALASGALFTGFGTRVALGYGRIVNAAFFSVCRSASEGYNRDEILVNLKNDSTIAALKAGAALLPLKIWGIIAK